PADVRAEGRLVDPAVGVHREDGGRDEAVEGEGHRLLREVATRERASIGIACCANRTSRLRFAIIDEMAQLDIFSLHDRVALICGGGGATRGATGAGFGGVGAAMAEASAGAGAKVAAAGRTPDSLAATVDRVRPAGSDGFAVVGDATSE